MTTARQSAGRLAVSVRRAVERMRAYHPPLEGRADKVRLDFNENPLGCSPAVRRAISRLSARAISMYPEQESVRRKTARLFGVRADELLLTNGTDEALSLIVQTFAEAGDRVLLIEPAYAMYRFYCELCGGVIASVRSEPGQPFPRREVMAELRHKPKLMFLANPNSPTGSLLSPVQIREILRAAGRTMVVVDEAYFEFSGVTMLPWLRRYPNLIVTRTFSKAAGLAGLRIGCIFVNTALAGIMRKAQSPYPVNSAALAAAEAALRDRGFIARTIRETRRAKSLLEAGLKKLGITFFPSAANFVLVYFGSGAPRIINSLARKGVLVRDRSGDFHGQGYVRITLGTAPQTRRFLRELTALWRGKPA